MDDSKRGKENKDNYLGIMCGVVEEYGRRYTGMRS